MGLIVLCACVLAICAIMAAVAKANGNQANSRMYLPPAKPVVNKVVVNKAGKHRDLAAPSVELTNPLRSNKFSREPMHRG